MSGSPHAGVKYVHPHQLGWLRRPELEEPDHDIWEKPDGELVTVQIGLEFMLRVEHRAGALPEVAIAYA